MQLCPFCSEPLPAGTGRSSAPREADETVEGVRCKSCGLMIFPAGVAATDTFVTSGQRRAGTMIAHFRLIRHLGLGAFGEVWLADDTSLDRKIALKLPKAGRFEGNLLHEAKAAAQLNHPNIVSVFEAGMAGGQEFIAIEYVEGQSLFDLMSGSSQAMSDDEVVRFLIPICEGLAHAHTNRIVHRDVKPGNILVDSSNNPLVTDFGLAKNVSGRETLSSDGQVLGTALYMAPEQAEGRTRETDHRADIYAVGVIFFELLTRHLPFRGTVQAVLRQKVEQDAPSPRTLKPKLDRDIETVCLKCLERDPGKRYQSAHEIVDELRRILRGEPIKARPIKSFERSLRWCKRRPVISGLAASLLLSLTGGLLGVSYFYVQAEQSGARARQSLYRSQMNLVSISLARGNVATVRGELDRIAADPELAPLREFSWYYVDHEASMLKLVGNHGTPVGDLAISHDGRLVASASSMNGPAEMRVWDVESEKQIWGYAPSQGRVLSVAFSPTRGHIATGGKDGWVRIFPATGGTISLAEFKHGPSVTTLGFSPDGRKLYSAGQRGAIRIWDVESQKLLIALATGDGNTADVEISPSGKIVASTSDQGFLRLRGIEDGARIADHRTAGATSLFAFVGRGDTVAVTETSAEPRVRVMSLDEWAPLRSYELRSQPGDLACIPGTENILVTELNGVVSAYCAASTGALRMTETHGQSFAHIALSVDGRYAAIAGEDGGIRVARTDDLIRQNNFRHTEPVRALCYGDQPQVAFSATESGVLQRWNLRTGFSETVRSQPKVRLGRVDYSRDRNLVAFGGFADNIEVWNADTLELLTTFETDGNGAANFQFLSDGSLLVALRDGSIVRSQLSSDGDVEKETVVNGRARSRGEIQNDPVVHDMAVLEERNLVFLGDSNGTVHQYRLSDGEQLRTLNVDITAISTLDAVNDPPRLIVGCNSGFLASLEADSLDAIWGAKRHAGRVNAIAYLPNDGTLISASRDNHIVLWHLATGEPISSLYGHARQVFSLDVRADGGEIISGSLDGEMRAWSAGLDR